jgi:hypothetical protein
MRLCLTPAGLSKLTESRADVILPISMGGSESDFSVCLAPLLEQSLCLSCRNKQLCCL